MYQMTKRIMSSEVGIDSRLKTLGLINILQDLENLHINNLNIFNDYLNKNHIGVFVNYRQINIRRRPNQLEEILLKTWPYDTKSFLGYRNSVIFDQENNPIIETYVLGSFVDLKTNKLAKLPVEVVNSLDNDLKYENINYLPRTIFVDDQISPVIFDSVKVKRVHIDTYQHMNNAFYITIAEDLNPDFEYDMIRAEYKKAFKENDIVVPYVYYDLNKITIILKSLDAIDHAIIEFSKN